MAIVDLNNRLINAYLELLKNLSPTSKLVLISKLTKSIQSDLKDKSNAFEQAFGAWDESENAEEITNKIRSGRSFNRKIEDL